MSEQEALLWHQELIRLFKDKPDDKYWSKEHNKTTRDAIGAAISALEKQVSKAPVNVAKKVGITAGNCPECGGLAFKPYKYCYRCGQRLEWLSL